MPCYRLWLIVICLLLAPAIFALQGCSSNVSGKSPDLESLAPCAIALAPQNDKAGKELSGEAQSLNGEISFLQQTAKKSADPKAYIEKLGWKFVEKARLSYDPGYYKIAEQCAACIEARRQQGPNSPKSNEALLLRGHVLHNLHRFKEAETVARDLVANRGLAFDYGLLGDALMEQGKLDEAIIAYQKMMDLKPSPQAYSRSAHLRWLKGDVEGAGVMAEMAAQSAGQGDPESAAWAYTRLSLFELQSGNKKKVVDACDAAINLKRDYAPALLACGKLMMADNRETAAVSLFRRAAKLNPLPEYQWTLAEALRAANREDEAREVERGLSITGERDDPRTLSLYLATRGTNTTRALQLAEAELKVRNDVYTLDALAWAQAASGNIEDAHKNMKNALSAGTKDARLFFHAAMIAAKSGRADEARRYYKHAGAIQQMLLPSERAQLQSLNKSFRL